MATKVIILASPNPEKADGAKAYSEKVQPLLQAAGVKPTFRETVSEVIAGGQPPSVVMLLEFPDAANASAFFAQDTYQALIPLRDESFSRMEIYHLG